MKKSDLVSYSGVNSEMTNSKNKILMFHDSLDKAHGVQVGYPVRDNNQNSRI